MSRFALVAQIVAWFAYFIYGNRLNRRAMDCIDDHSRLSSVFALLDSSALGERGRKRRQRALTFWVVGGVALVGFLVLVGKSGANSSERSRAAA